MERSTTMSAATWTQDSQPLPRRNVWQAMARGLLCRCPNCGEGKVFRAFLKVADDCSKCGESLSGHRADDLPAYLVIVVVGHIIVPIALWVEMNHAPSVLLQLAFYLPFTLIASLALLQPIKGAVVGLQWAFRMHGFDKRDADGVEDSILAKLNVVK